MGCTREETLRREKLAEQGLKVCGKCKRELPFDCFAQSKSTKDGLYCYCKDCKHKNDKEYTDKNAEYMKEKTKQWQMDNPERYKEMMRQYRDDNREKIQQYREENRERLNQYKRDHWPQYYEKHKDELIDYQRQYRDEHPDICATRHRQYYQDHVNEILAKHKIYYQEHIEELRKKKAIYTATHKEQRRRWLRSESGRLSSRRSAHKRRMLLKDRGDFTIEEVLIALDFFDYQCAYTGETLEECYHLDHVVPVIKGGYNYIWNIVPSNPAPNLSKGASDMEEWYRQQPYFSEERLHKIYEWVDLQKSIKGEENYESRNIEETASGE